MTGTNELDGVVVVITGASSGIGRATACYCAERGARVVLGARRGEVVAELAETLVQAGGKAIGMAADVTDPAALRALAEAAVGEFGGIDVWVNNAGVYSVGPFEDTPVEVFDELIAVDLMGVVSGSRVALEQFRLQGRGTLINVSSMIGGLAGPQVSAYATAKWGVRGFSFALREELRDAPGIEVCVVRPSGIDTPIFRHAANFSGRRLKALSPTYPPEQAAQVIAHLITHPRREVVVGGSGKALVAVRELAAPLVDRVFGERAQRNHFVDGERADPTRGNVFEPDTGWKTASGDWPTVKRTRQALVLPLVAATVAGLAVHARRS
jgi:NAD(P)-dependent dehydrogenase (short-subunit alcohol dehydrogenase family)